LVERLLHLERRGVDRAVVRRRPCEHRLHEGRRGRPPPCCPHVQGPGDVFAQARISRHKEDISPPPGLRPSAAATPPQEPPTTTTSTSCASGSMLRRFNQTGGRGRPPRRNTHTPNAWRTMSTPLEEARSRNTPAPFRANITDALSDVHAPDGFPPDRRTTKSIFLHKLASDHLTTLSKCVLGQCKRRPFVA
jgi:hypothetical protein